MLHAQSGSCHALEVITARFGVVLNLALALALGAIRGRRDELAVLEGALDVEVVPDLVEDLALAAERDLGAVLLGQDALDLGHVVRLAGRGRDAGRGEPLVRWQRLEEADGAREEVGRLLAVLVAVAVARGLKGADAGAVLAPLVLPELLVVALVVLPVLVHVVERVAGVVGLEDLGDVGVSAIRVTLRRVGAVAVVGPETVNGPRVYCRNK